jgi:hypothetical protein
LPQAAGDSEAATVTGTETAVTDAEVAS